MRIKPASTTTWVRTCRFHESTPGHRLHDCQRAGDERMRCNTRLAGAFKADASALLLKTARTVPLILLVLRRQ